MIIYFTDRNLKVLGQASTSLPGGFRISEDLTTEEIDSGVNTFSCKINYTEANRGDIEEAAVVGRYILKSNGAAFEDSEELYDSLYQIVETEFDTENQTIYLYAEDAGLELLGKIVPGVTLTGTISQMLAYFMPSDWDINLIDVPGDVKTYTWDGENSATERIKSVAGLFDCEVYYSFEIERLKVYSKTLNVIKKRGLQEAKAQLRLNRDIGKIITKKSIKNLATAYTVRGGTPEGSETPINLVGYVYHYHDYDTDDDYEVDTATGQMRNITAMERWASELDPDGLIIKSFEFDTTDKAVLAGQARAALQKASVEEVNYEVDFLFLPDGTQVGDRINVIDEEGELFLETRILQLETSVADETIKATIGDNLIKDSGINDRVQAIADQFSKQAKAISGTTISIASSGGNVFHNEAISTQLSATVFFGTEAITTQAKLEKVYGEAAAIKWYFEGVVVHTGFEPFAVSSTDDIAKYIARLEA